MFVMADELSLAESSSPIPLWQACSCSKLLSSAALGTVQTRWQVQSIENQEDSKLKVDGFSKTCLRCGISLITSLILVKKAGLR